MRKKLIELRKGNNLSQEQMANFLGISRAFYGMIETGKRNPTLNLAKKIAEIFKVDIEEVFFENSCNEMCQNRSIIIAK
ncbi:MAG: putative transcriptional regulator [Thermoanaerobacteraceae bacterium]|nr:putative transcriptional regulator [Thermoanaerobacteraceae bacterium]